MQSPLTRSPPFFDLRLKPRQPFVWESRSLQYTPKELGGAAINISKRNLESLPHIGTRPAGQFSSRVWTVKGARHACKTEHLFHALPRNWPSFSDTPSSYHGPTVHRSLASSCFTFHAIAARLWLGRCLKLQSWRQARQAHIA